MRALVTISDPVSQLAVYNLILGIYYRFISRGH